MCGGNTLSCCLGSVCLQELRKASGQQLREVQVVQGEAVKQLQDERHQAERKEAQLKVCVCVGREGRVLRAVRRLGRQRLLSLALGCA